MVRKLLRRFGPLVLTLALVCLVVPVSLAITYIILIANGRQEVGLGLTIATVCTLAIAPPVAYYALSLLSKLDRSEQSLIEANHHLETALQEVKELSGLLPICASCKKIRDDEGYWNTIESYLADHSRAELTHSICPDCAKRAIEEIQSIAASNGRRKRNTV